MRPVRCAITGRANTGVATAISRALASPKPKSSAAINASGARCRPVMASSAATSPTASTAKPAAAPGSSGSAK